MAMIEEFDQSGNWLFRWRSFLPVILYLMAALVIVFEGDNDFDHFNLAVAVSCLAVSLFGLLIRIVTIGFTPKGTSGRNTREGQVAETLNTIGIYSVVRHPLYLGNFFMWLGIVIYVGNWWFTVVCCLLFWLYYERIMFAEENFLRKKFGQDYLGWSSTVPAFWPAIFQWRKSGVQFSLRNVLKREYNGFFAIFVSFALLDVLKNYTRFGFISWYQLISPFWMWLLLASFILFITLRTLKKKTNYLDAPGREFQA